MKKIIYLPILLLSIVSFNPKTLTWVAIGDSITYLNDHTDETGNRVTKGYMTRVCEKLPDLHYINQGHNGWTSGGIADSIDNLGILPADIYSIFLGTNDWWQGRPAGDFEDYKKNTGDSTVSGSFGIIIRKIRSLNKNARIILITPMQRTDFVYINDMKNNAFGSYRKKNGQSLEEVAVAIRHIAEYEHLELIDLYHDEELSVPHLVKFKRLKNPKTKVYTNYLYPEYTEIPFNPETDQYPYPVNAIDKTYDGLHPSDAGNKIIAGNLINLLK
jgi:lysophospholipase L1-like esterase